MGLQKNYLKVGQSAKNRLFGVSPFRTPSRGVAVDGDRTPLQMLISEEGKVSHGRLAVIVFGLFTLVMGIILSSIPWVDYIIAKNLRLLNGSLAFQYWQKPGVLRLTKVYIFNVTNPEGFLNNGEKPKVTEVGPFVYREDMEKVNVAFHDNGTLTFQHKKILHFMPEMSIDNVDEELVVPNIPLLTLSTMSNGLPRIVRLGLSIMLRTMGLKPFIKVTPEEFIFGYDDPLLNLAKRFFPKHKRPMDRMGLLFTRNGTITDRQTIYNGETGMQDLGLMTRLNGLDHLPQWRSAPCNDIRGSEGSFFPPPDVTKSEVIRVFDKDICRVLPLKYQYKTTKDGIDANYYAPSDGVFAYGDDHKENDCFCPEDNACPVKGLQDISACQFDAPVFLSFPHFYKSDPSLLDAIDGLEPDKEKHEFFIKLQPKIGVPLEAKGRLQLNLKVEKAPNIHAVSKFPDIVFPIMWIEEGVDELPATLHTLVYLATTFADVAIPLFTYGSIVFGSSILVFMFVRAYKNVILSKEAIEKGKETLEKGREKLRRGSSFLINGQHRMLIVRDSYTLLDNKNVDPDPDPDPDV